VTYDDDTPPRSFAGRALGMARADEAARRAMGREGDDSAKISRRRREAS